MSERASDPNIYFFCAQNCLKNILGEILGEGSVFEGGEALCGKNTHFRQIGLPVPDFLRSLVG